MGDFADDLAPFVGQNESSRIREALAKPRPEPPRPRKKRVPKIAALPKHVVIPDTQIRPDVPTAHLEWIGQYIADEFAGEDLTIIHLGDHWDMPSLSSYDRGKKQMEGRRVVADIFAGNNGFALLDAPISAVEKWNPRKVYFRGNHEERIQRAIDADPQLEGLLSLDLLDTHGWEVHPFLDVVNIDGVAYCLAPHHRILMADLSYRELDDVNVGDEIVAFDEHGKDRGFSRAAITRCDQARARLYRVTLPGRQTFDVTSEHKFLARRRKRSGGAGPFEWVRTADLVVGQHELCQPLDDWDQDHSWEAGYLCGIFDGEGCVVNAGKQGLQISVAQNEGPVLDKIRRILDEWDVRYNQVRRPSGCTVLSIRGKLRERLEFLARINPVRLINKIDPSWFGKMLTHDDEHNVVASVEPIGRGEIIQLETSTGTLIVEGYAQHNSHYFYNPMTGRPYGGQNIDTRLKTIGHSFTMGHQQGLGYGIRNVLGQMHHGLVAGSCYLHDEDYKGPQGNAHWRGIVVCNQVENGSYDPMFVSLDFLCRKYEGIRLTEFMEKQ